MLAIRMINNSYKNNDDRNDEDDDKDTNNDNNLDDKKSTISQMKKIEKATDVIEKSIRTVIKSKRILRSNVKDNLSDRIDEVNDTISDLKNKAEISTITEKRLKQEVEKIKSQLDMGILR